MAPISSCVLGFVFARVGLGLFHRQNPDPRAAVSKWSSDETQIDDIFMHYMPSRNLVVCGCGKCGTSSMYEYLYTLEFGHPWTYEWAPYIQDVVSERWEGRWEHIVSYPSQQRIMASAFSYALIRDPKERLVSAWKSKVACSTEDYGTDSEAKDFVRNLRTLQGLPLNNSVKCMSLDDFAESLMSIHEQGKAMQLDRHFLPQNYGCFDRFGPGNWSKLTTVEESGSLEALAGAFGMQAPEAPHDHASPHKVLVSDRVADILDSITKHEYKTIGDFMPRKSLVYSGVWVTGQHGYEGEEYDDYRK